MTGLQHGGPRADRGRDASLAEARDRAQFCKDAKNRLALSKGAHYIMQSLEPNKQEGTVVMMAALGCIAQDLGALSQLISKGPCEASVT